MGSGQWVIGGGSVQHIDPKGSFLKNLTLSLLLIGLTSLLIPIVLKQIDDRKTVDQQRLQAELARQGTIIAEQAELLDSLAAAFWDYEVYASDVLYSRDARFGRPDWHQRAVDAYYVESGPLLGQMRADISQLLRLAPRDNYEAFLRLYENEILPLDSCLLELMKAEATPTPDSQSARCLESDGRFAGSTWDTLMAHVVEQDLAANLDREFERLARAFLLHHGPD
jgi:hypothetical protein